MVMCGGKAKADGGVRWEEEANPQLQACGDACACSTCCAIGGACGVWARRVGDVMCKRSDTEGRPGVQYTHTNTVWVEPLG